MIALSGLSGAGKSTAAKILEDQGYFVVDNLPAELLSKLIELGGGGQQKRPLAFVIDSRNAEGLEAFAADWKLIRNAQLWFLEATDPTLLKRFQETRRPHPMDTQGEGVLPSIEKERYLLAPLHRIADKIIETDDLSPHDLRTEIIQLLGAKKPIMPKVRLLSFGFKHGLPSELDLCFDVRFIQNPYFVESLKALTGLDKAVKDFVLETPSANIFLRKTVDLLKFLLPCYVQEHKSYLTIAIGCTGGRHRSVVLVQEIAQKLERAGFQAQITHRDLKV